MNSSAEDWLRVESLDLEAQGIAHRPDGKVVFIEGALPGEEVRVHTVRKKERWEQAHIADLRCESALRVTPQCPHFGLCGGCAMQHLHPGAQVAVKQRALEDNLWHLGQVRAEQWLRPIEGPFWGYRLRARLSVRHVAKKQTVLVGFHERKSSFIADMRRCEILPPHVSRLLLPLRALIADMTLRDRLPQIEIAVTDKATALVLRHLEPLGPEDLERLRAFARDHAHEAHLQWWLQPQGPASVHPLDPRDADLAYELPEFGVRMPFMPTDFTQVNHAINRVLVERAVRFLDPRIHEQVIDWFCGLGNFTLPLATRSATVLGIEGSETLVERARRNAALNHLQSRTRFEARNLFEITAADLQALPTADKWLVDPPREGAFALVKALCERHEAWRATPQALDPRPQRIVYVSCNPSTLARDAGLLVNVGGYRLTHAGAVNMFPHTAHVESMAVFERVRDEG